MKKKMLKPAIILTVIKTLSQENNQYNQNRWSIEKAEDWYSKHSWIIGADFIPSTAINQLEMWQKETFDPETIDKELGYAENIGMNTVRVYLHSLVYKDDAEGFKNRMETYLKIANKHSIKTIFVIFDDVWGKNPKMGPQPSPTPGVHNSGWVQDPGDPASTDEKNFPELKIYVQDIIKTFSNDDRILMWDLYNEPGNSNKLNSSLPLLSNVFEWAREINPSQPLTAGMWTWSFEELNEFQALNSDVITYHHYGDASEHQEIINVFKVYGKPIICTEYMARTRNSRFSNILPLLKKENIGAINWGLVAGKSNTIHQWDIPTINGEEPIEWFHDIFKNDGSPYRQDEVNLIKKLTSEN